jgi:murein DD-endopeptidase MepM/ murein hydrolase activator NlpD
LSIYGWRLNVCGTARRFSPICAISPVGTPILAQADGVVQFVPASDAANKILMESSAINSLDFVVVGP